MRYVATDLAERVSGAMEGLTYRRDVTLDARYREVRVGLRHPTAEQLEWAAKRLALPTTPKGPSVQAIAYAKWFQQIADDGDDAGEPTGVPHWGRVHRHHAMRGICRDRIGVQNQAPFKHAFMVELAHATPGYLPTPRHFALGGYETWLGTNRLEPQASVKMMDQLLEMADDLKQAARAEPSR